MKSYIEPLNAADALDVLYAHGIPFGDISYSRDNDEDAVLHGPGGDKVLRTPDDVIAALGDDAARALAEHKRFRERAVRELMVPVLSDGESIYNVRTGDTFILDSNCEGKLYGFDYTVTPLATLVDEGEDGIPYGAGVYAIETYGADMGHIDDLPDGECPDPLTFHSTVEDDDLSYSVASVLRSMERTALELEAGGDLFDLSGSIRPAPSSRASMRAASRSSCPATRPSSKRRRASRCCSGMMPRRRSASTRTFAGTRPRS